MAKEKKKRKSRVGRKVDSQLLCPLPCPPVAAARTAPLCPSVSLLANRHLFHLPFMLQLPDLLLKVLDHGLRFFHGGFHHAPLAAPSSDTFSFALASAVLGIDLFAKLALPLDIVCLVDEFHPAGFAHPIFVVALGSKAAPRPVSARKVLLVIKTHVSYTTYPLDDSQTLGPLLLTCAGFPSLGFKSQRAPWFVKEEVDGVRGSIW